MTSDALLRMQQICLITRDSVYELYMKIRGQMHIHKMLLAKTLSIRCETTSPSQYGDHTTSKRQAFSVPGGRCTLMVMASACDICPCP